MIVRDEIEIAALGKQLANSARPGQLITLRGSLGAGKTTLARAIIGELGFAGDVSSPSFSIINQYDGGNICVPVVHADLYRLEDPDELEELGLFSNEGSLMIVEWPEKGGYALSDPDIEVFIEIMADGSRRIEIKQKDADVG